MGNILSSEDLILSVVLLSGNSPIRTVALFRLIILYCPGQKLPITLRHPTGTNQAQDVSVGYTTRFFDVCHKRTTSR